MGEEYSVSRAAKLAGTTAETLRHYDRLGLVRPSRVDGENGYRYYGRGEILTMRTVGLLREMGLSLAEIGAALGSRDLREVAALLRRAEDRAGDKISRLRAATAKIAQVRAGYEEKLLQPQNGDGPQVRRIPARMVLRSKDRGELSLETLWDYLAPFYVQLPPEQREKYAFEDAAGLLTQAGESRLFAVCTKYPCPEGLTILPEGDYLCAPCTEEDRAEVLADLLARTGARWHIHRVVVTGILHWSYEIQVPIDKSMHTVYNAYIQYDAEV